MGDTEGVNVSIPSGAYRPLLCPECGVQVKGGVDDAFQVYNVSRTLCSEQWNGNGLNLPFSYPHSVRGVVGLEFMLSWQHLSKGFSLGR